MTPRNGEIEALESRSRVLVAAQQRVDTLRSQGVNAKARETVHGIEIEIERPASWRGAGYVSRSWEIIPWS